MITINFNISAGRWSDYQILTTTEWEEKVQSGIEEILSDPHEANERFAEFLYNASEPCAFDLLTMTDNERQEILDKFRASLRDEIEDEMRSDWEEIEVEISEPELISALKELSCEALGELFKRVMN
jgi:hypothetical protein